MPRQTCGAIESLPALTEPVSVVAIDVYRDGGSVEVTLEDAQAQRLILFFACGVGIRPRGRLYLKVTSCMRPITFHSSAETEAFRLLRQHLAERYAPEEQALLAALEGGSVRNLCRHDLDGWTLLRCLKQAEELRKLVTWGVVPDPVSFRLGG